MIIIIIRDFSACWYHCWKNHSPQPVHRWPMVNRTL